MLKEVLIHPNKKLRETANPVLKFDDDLKAIIVNMIDTCRVMFGVGLAAPQIGVSKRIVVIKPSEFKAENHFPASYNEDYMVMINPVVQLSGQDVEWREACLSVPGVDGKVTRKEKCTVKFLDENGEMQVIETGFPFSGGLQHEIDHLDGVLYISKMDKKKRRSLMWKIQRNRRKEMIAERKRKRNLSIGGNYG